MTYLNCNIHDEKLCQSFLVIDLDTGEELNDCIWADDKCKKYCVFKKDENGRFVSDKNGLKREVKKGNIKLVYKGD